MRKVILLAILTLGATAARAENDLFYLGAGVSYNSVTKITDLANEGSIEGTSWKAFAGIRPIKLLAVEADYLDLGNGHTAETVSPNRCADLYNLGLPCGFDAHSHGTAYAGYLAGFLPIPFPKWDIYAKAGAAHWKLDGYIVQGATSGFSESGTDFAWGSGVQVHITQFGARFEYETFDIPHTNGAQIASLSVFWNF